MAQSYAEAQDTVTVSIQNGVGYNVVSENPILVTRGNDALFKIRLWDNYEFLSASCDAEFQNGILSVKNVLFPMTIELYTQKTAGELDVVIPIIPDDPTEDTPTTDEPTDDPFNPDDPFDPFNPDAPADDPFDPFNPDAPTEDTPTEDDKAPDNPTEDNPATDEPTEDTHEHTDLNLDHSCDADCGKDDMGEHKDENLDHVCDYGCQARIGICEDADKNHECDYGCTKRFGECVDADKNHVCDYGCEISHGEHSDGEDNNHTCDYGCGLIADEGCYDSEPDGECDECGVDMNHTCADTDKNHACDICSANIGTHEDTNLDHVCDYGCENPIGSCVDADKNHTCDYGCQKDYGDCTDTDRNKKCDYCSVDFIDDCNEHTDTDRDRKCDYCSVDYIAKCDTHTDVDRDKSCDYCTAKYIAECNEHTDEDGNLVCDYCDSSFTPEYIATDLKANPKDGFKFICWTLDAPATEGGAVFATENEGRFNVPYGCEALANYVEVGFDVILYRTNGGRVSETGKDYYYQTVSNEHYYLPNTLHQNGTFVRDGYQLLRYSVSANGKGDYTTLGGNIEPNKNGFIELYLIWAAATKQGLVINAVKTDSGEYVAHITKYTGSGGAVVIPEYITAAVGGQNTKLKVERILAGAFENSAITSLALPATIHTVEDGAFKNCKSLTTLYLHDNCYQINDAAFEGCSIPKLYLNAGRLPAMHTGAEGMNAYKYDKIRLAAKNGQKKIIVFSGSSSLYGFRAEDMYNAFEGEYAVINFGNNAGTLSPLFMEAFSQWYGEGDIIIHAPESSGTQNGDLNLGNSGYLMFRGSEAMYEIYSYVDMSRVKGFFTGLTVYNQQKRNKIEGSSYEKVGDSINEYTDYTKNVDNPNYKSATKNSNPYDLNVITDVRAEYLNSVYDKVTATGARLYRSFSPVNYDACSSTAKDPQTHAAFIAKIESMLHITVISNPANYMLEQKYFNNSDAHPGIEGSKIRTAQLIADVKAQLALEAAAQ